MGASGASASVRGFTLIELLIVVLILAILSSIALPNMMEFTIRAKVARVKTEFRTLATMLEGYYVDNDAYPPGRFGADNIFPLTQRLFRLTTPIAYLTSLPIELFDVQDAYVAPTWNVTPLEHFDTYDYFDQASDKLEEENGDVIDSTRESVWRLSSAGPDLYHAFSIIAFGGVEYDPTNGSISIGDITRLGARVEWLDEDFSEPPTTP